MDKEGGRIGSFAMVSDISKLKQAEADLRQANEELEDRIKERTAELSEAMEELLSVSEDLKFKNDELEKLSIVASKTDNAIIIMDSYGNTEWVNDAFIHIHGLDLEGLHSKYGKNINSFSTNEDITAIIEQCRESKISSTYYSSNLQHGDSKVWLQTTLSPIVDVNGNVLKIIAIDSDVSKLKEAQEEITQQNEELKQQSEELIAQQEALYAANEAISESEEKFSTIIDFLPDAAFVIDKYKKVILWNKAVEELTGIKAEEIIGKGNYEYSIGFYGERRPILIDLLFLSDDELREKYAFLERKGDALIAEAYAPLIKGGTHFHGKAVLLYNSNKEIIGAIEIVRDITEIKRSEIALKEFNQKLSDQKDEIVNKSYELTELVEQLQITNELMQAANSELVDKNTEIEKQKAEIIKQNKLMKLQQKEIMQQSKELNIKNVELEKLSIVASKTNNGVIITDGRGNFEWVNEGFTKLCGYTLEELINEQGSNIISEKTDAKVKDIINKCLIEKISVDFEYFAPRKSGGGIWVQTSLTPIINDNQAIIKLVAIDTDISKIKEAEEKIKIQREELIIKSLELSELVEEVQANNSIIETINQDLEQRNVEVEQQKEELLVHNELLKTQKEEISHQKKQMTDSIQYAKRIQSAILPNDSYISRLLPHNFVFFNPSDIVSGDFYWMRHKNTKIYLAAVDCTGHGVPGAFMSMLAFAFLNEIINNTEKSICPNEILNQLRMLIIKSLKQKGKIGEAHDGMDMAMVSLDFDSYSLQFSGANLPIYYIKKKIKTDKYTSDAFLLQNNLPINQDFIRIEEENEFVLLEIKGDAMPVGIYINDKNSFTNYEIKMKESDSFYIFTDGYTSQFGGPTGRKFLTKSFRKLIFALQDLPLEVQKQTLQGVFEDWKGEKYEQVDDILVIGIRI